MVLIKLLFMYRRTNTEKKIWKTMITSIGEVPYVNHGVVNQKPKGGWNC